MTNNAERELLPCPFCGGTADYDQMPDDGSLDANKWQVGCIETSCYGYDFRYKFERKADALKAWNTRAQASGVPDEKRQEDYEQDEDGHADAYCQGHMDGWNACRDAMLAAVPTPPKSASVPVERLENLLKRCAIGAYAFTVPQKWIEALIAEYK